MATTVAEPLAEPAHNVGAVLKEILIALGLATLAVLVIVQLLASVMVKV